jgi:hypothetical protein
MAKFPNSPGASALVETTPTLVTLPAGSALARVYYTSSAHPLAWNQFRSFGPLNFRWDHHLPTVAAEPREQGPTVYYAAADAVTCLAEVFQATRRIDRVYQAPWLVIFNTLRALSLLDLTGDFATCMGASMAIHSGSLGAGFVRGVRGRRGSRLCVVDAWRCTGVCIQRTGAAGNVVSATSGVSSCVGG